MDYEIDPMSIKALMIHHIEEGEEERKDIGWGRFPLSPDEILYTGDDSATVIYQGDLTVKQWIRAPIPLPKIEINGKVTIKATFCYSTTFTPEHPVNYTRAGLEATFRPNASKTKTFFSKGTQYQTEQEARQDAHKWEAVMKNTVGLLPGSLDTPCFDIVYRARDGGDSIDDSLLEDLGADTLKYCLVVTVQANNTPVLYDAVRQQYQILEPIRVRDRVELSGGS